MNGHNFQEMTPPGVRDVAQAMLFKEIWSKMGARSFVSGFWLRSYVNTPLWQNCFLRVLPIRNFRYFQFYAGNIILCTPGEKGLWEQGSAEERIHYALTIEENSRGKGTANWDGVGELAKDLEELYKKHFPATYKGIVNYNYSLQEQQIIIGKLNIEFWRDFQK